MIISYNFSCCKTSTLQLKRVNAILKCWPSIIMSHTDVSISYNFRSITRVILNTSRFNYIHPLCNYKRRSSCFLEIFHIMIIVRVYKYMKQVKVKIDNLLSV